VLDEPELMMRNDRVGMLQATTEYPEQWRQALAMELPDLSALPRDPKQVLFTGMGGSGSGGEFARMLLDREGGPVGRFIHDYDIPAWVGPSTLVAASSYSGGTEETLTGVMRAVEKKAPWFAVTTGGLLADAAKRHGAPWLRVPGGFQPRAAFGYLTVGLLRVLMELGVLSKDRLQVSLERTAEGLDRVKGACGPEVPTQKNPAKQLANLLASRPVMVVADTSWSPVAERVRCQFNENSKALAFSRILPEANHNDTVAWSRASRVEEWSAVFLGAFDRLAPIQERATFLRETLVERGVRVHEIMQDHEDPVARMFLTAYQADWVSIYLGFKHGMDPGEVDVIPRMKDRVAKTGHVDFVRKQLGL
jgi:glucose/mannose-6-phosphate isomerase